uniref:hypothetical protein n=1 Tax=Escherichia coli TaxID=562 RepID=UPI001BCF04F2
MNTNKTLGSNKQHSDRECLYKAEVTMTGKGTRFQEWMPVFFKLNLQSKCNKKRSTHQLEYNFVSTQKPFPNDEYFLPTSYNKRA